MHDALAILLWDDYATHFKELTGKFPRYAPTSGTFFEGNRTWASYFHGEAEQET
jgi:hypothetical protein